MLRVLLFLMVAAFGTAGVFALDVPAVEQKLRDTYEGKVWTLRRPVQGAQIRYDAKGQVLDSAEPGPWTLYGTVQVHRLRLGEGGLCEIEGARYFLAFNQQENKFQRIPANESVKIVVALGEAAVNEAAARTALDTIFAPTENADGVAPAHWVRFLNGSKAQADPNVFRVRDLTRPPQLLDHAEPFYNPIARRSRLEGTVAISAIINEKGMIEDPQIVQPLGLGLDDSAVDALLKWKFEPGMKEGKPVKVRAVIDVVFRLH